MTKQSKKRGTTKLKPSGNLSSIPPMKWLFKEGDRVKAVVGLDGRMQAYGTVKAVWADSVNLVLKPKGRVSESYKGTWYVELIGSPRSRRFGIREIERFGEEVCSFKAVDAPDFVKDVVVSAWDGRKSKPAAKAVR